MKTLAEIKSILQTQKPYLAQKYGVVEIGVFGSYVRGDHTRNWTPNFTGNCDVMKKDYLDYVEDIIKAMNKAEKMAHSPA